MAHILNSTSVVKPVTKTVTDDNGQERTVEDTVNLVRDVTFMIDQATPHTLTFLDKGSLIKDGNGVERVVGDSETAYHEFTDPEEAVNAYLDGKV